MGRMRRTANASGNVETKEASSVAGVMSTNNGNQKKGSFKS